MKQKLISLSFLLIFLSFCVLVVDTFVGKIEVQFSEKPLISSAFLALSALHTKEIFPSFYLVAGGDIMFSRNIGYYNKKRGYDRIFGSGQFNPVSKFSSCIAGNCLLFFNLESLFHPKDNDIQMGGFTFRANTANIEILKDLRKPSLEQANELGQNLALLLSLANNHTVNVGYEGIIATQDTLHVGGDIDSIGAGTTSEQAHRFFIMEPSEGFTICAQAYSYEGRENIKVWWGLITRNPLVERAVLADLEEMKSLGCDVKILSLHRGAEYRLHPNQRQKNLAHTLIENGADLILGGHSHVPGEIEQYQGKYIFYSFGNFIFDQGRGKKASEVGFDYIYDYELGRRTVPTYISMLAGLQMVKFPNGVKILWDQLEMSTMTDGVHQPLDEETFSGILKEINFRGK